MQLNEAIHGDKAGPFMRKASGTYPACVTPMKYNVHTPEIECLQEHSHGDYWAEEEEEEDDIRSPQCAKKPLDGLHSAEEIKSFSTLFNQHAHEF